MNNDKDFSLEDSEELINNLKSGGAPELEKLRSTLNLLSYVHELSPISVPPILPSEVDQPVQLLTRTRSKTRRTMVTSILSVAILASASLAAAAVTGRGPAPMVSVGHQSAKFVKAVAGAISDAVTGKHDENSPTPSPGVSSPGLAPSDSEENEGDLAEDSGHSLTGPSSLPSGAGDDHFVNSNDDSDDGGTLPSITPSSKPRHADEKSPAKGPEEGEHENSINDRFRTPVPEPTTVNPSGIPKPTSSPEDDSSEDEEDD